MAGVPLVGIGGLRLVRGGLRSALGLLGCVILAALFVLPACARSQQATTTGTPAATSTRATSAAPATTTQRTAAPTSAAATTTAPKPAAPAGPYGDLKVAVASFGEEIFFPPPVGNIPLIEIGAPIYDWMFGLKALDLAPEVVEKWELARDGLSWTYSVRKGIKFHTGDDLTGEDLKWSLEQYAGPRDYHTFLRGMIDNIQLVDSYTVRIATKGTQPYMPNMSTLHDPSDGAVLPKRYIEQNGLPNFEQRPVGSGSYKFVRRVPGDFVEYEAVKGHWRRTPDFQKLTVTLMPEEATRMAALKTGEADVIEVGLDGARELEAAGFRAPTMDRNSILVALYGAYHPDGAKMPIASVKVRQALSLAINRDEISKNFFYGKATPPFVLGLIEGTADVDSAQWKSYAAKTYVFDPAKAKQLLAEAGYPDGFPIKLYGWTTTGATFLPKLGEVVAEYWKKVGVKAQMTPIVWNTFAPLRAAPHPDLMGQASMYRSSNNPVTPKPLQNFLSSTGPNRLLSRAMPDMEKLLTDMMTEPDAGKRKAMIKEVLERGTEFWVEIPIVDAPSMAGLGPKVDVDFPSPAPNQFLYYLKAARHK